MERKQLALLLDSLIRGPLVERWLSRTADFLAKFDLDLVAIGVSDISSLDEEKYKNFFFYLFNNFREDVLYWRLREKRFFDCFCNLTGTVLEGPRLSRLNEPAAKESTYKIKPDSPLLWWIEPPRGEPEPGWLTLLGSETQPERLINSILSELAELSEVSGVQVAANKSDDKFHCSEQLEVEYCQPEKVKATELTWLLDSRGANVLRALDQLQHSALIAARSAPWDELLGEQNKELLYPAGEPLFGVEVVDRLIKNGKEKKGLIKENKDKLGLLEKRAHQYIEEKFLGEEKTGLE